MDVNSTAIITNRVLVMLGVNRDEGNVLGIND
jgi:hypothetical protein